MCIRDRLQWGGGPARPVSCADVGHPSRAIRFTLPRGRAYNAAPFRRGRTRLMEQARTVGELRRAGYQVAPVREEMRRNLLAKLTSGERILNGIVGYDDSVVPEIENAILAGHH